MLYAFTDESYNSDLYLQGALIVDESKLQQLEGLIREVKGISKQFGVSEMAEIHGHSIMNASHGWEPLQGKFHAKIELFKLLLTGMRRF